MIRVVPEAQGIGPGLSLYGVEFGPGTPRRITDRGYSEFPTQRRFAIQC